ncbi:MAG TPA: sigma 54-interacting transcriptional regulator [Candidatus Binatia bacterium]|nr:sigma 54-interacting transcriptional regulator [Candidatus Binatia bacterium]
MAIFTASEQAAASAIARLAYTNPFLPDRIECERQALGSDFVDAAPVWSIQPDAVEQNPNVGRLARRAADIVQDFRERTRDGARPTDHEAALYEDVALYLLYARFEEDLWELVVRPSAGRTARVPFYGRFVRAAGELLTTTEDVAHVFACFFQIRRAFQHTFRGIVGGSLPAARLRAAVWQSIFTHDMRRYRRTLYRQMDDINTLVTGPSGTGKELVARAIGLSRYIPFDATSQTFAADFTTSFHPLSISALAPTLVESELFGHRRGAFTGALADRAGWLETCGALGTVFLDEIGELDPALQVKLLRVLQARTFEPLGDTTPRRFTGKLVAATNRDLAAEMRAGRFREDFYYRLCADRIVTPSLREQIADRPDELGTLVLFLARRIAGPEEAEPIAREVATWIERNLGRDYEWPGNVRELEQCVRSVLVRREYRPPSPVSPTRRQAVLDEVAAGTLTADELLSHYCTLVYADTRSYQETARRLRLDRRTVRSKIDADLLAALETK